MGDISALRNRMLDFRKGRKCSARLLKEKRVEDASKYYGVFGWIYVEISCIAIAQSVIAVPVVVQRVDAQVKSPFASNPDASTICV